MEEIRGSDEKRYSLTMAL